MVNRKKDLVTGMRALMEHPEFFESVSGGTTDTRKVGIRFRRMRGLVQGVLS